MKRILITITVLASTCGFIQAQDFGIRGGLSFASQVEPGIGLNVGAIYQIQEHLGVAAGATFYIPDSYKGTDVLGVDYKVKRYVWMVDTDARYGLPINDGAIYGLAGLNFTTHSITYNKYDGSVLEDSKDTYVGLNIGGGAEYAFAYQVKAFAEAKYVISNYDQLIVNLGVLYTFGY